MTISRFAVWGVLGCLAGAGAGAADPPGIRVTEPAEAGERRRVEVFGDWHIREPVRASNTLYQVHGNIVLETNGVWEITDSELQVMCEHSRQYQVRWEGGRLVTRNATVGGNVKDGRLRACNFELKDGSWDGVDTTVQHCYAIAFHWNDEFVGILRGKRFNAGPNPDSIIVSGAADILLEDSTFPISLGLYTEKGGTVHLDLPTDRPLDRVLDASSLCGAEPWRVELRNVTVPHWFVFVRNIWPGNPPCEIVIDRCESLMVSLLGHNVTGDVQLSDDLGRPVTIGSVTVRRGEGPVNLHMYGGMYFSGQENDARVFGPARIAEVMLWGGRVRMEGTDAGELYLGCTTLDVHGNGHLDIRRARLGRQGGNGQIIVREQGRVSARDVRLGDLILRTEDEGRITFRGAETAGTLTLREEGGPVEILEDEPPEPDVRAALQAHDRAVHVLDDWMRDPYILLADDGFYYLTATRLTHVRGGVAGIPVWRSRDLAEWTHTGVPWTFDDSRWIRQLEAVAAADGRELLLWAPELHPLGDRWVAVHTTNSRRANLVVSGGATGFAPPFTEPMGADFGHRHDPSIFTDIDGSRWLVWGCTRIQKLKADLSGFDGEAVPIGPSDRTMGHEGSYLARIDGTYVLFGTAWSRDQLRQGTYNLYYCTADTLTGPYGPRRFAGRFLGHGTPFRDKQGRWWCTAFLNGQYVTPEHVADHELDPRQAWTINRQGLTLVPLDVRRDDAGRLVIRALDPAYAHPGPEEIQS